MRLLAVLVFLLVAVAAPAHEIDYVVHEGASRTVEVKTADGRPFAFESSEIFGPGDRTPHQVGRTDKHGRVSFVPDRIGEWTVKVFSEDGHGLTATIQVQDLHPAVISGDRGPNRGLRILIGVAIVALLGGAMYWRSRSES